MQACGLCVLLLFLSDQYYLKICRADLRQIFRVDRTMGVDDQPEICSSIHQRTLPWQPIFVGFGRRRLVAQPGGLTLGFALYIVCLYF